MTDASFNRRLLTVAAIGVGLLLVVRLADVLLLIFGAFLVALLLHAVAGPIRSRTPLGRSGSLAVAVVIVVAAVSGAAWAFGQQLETQITSLVELLPRAWTDLEVRLSGSPLGALLLRELSRLPAGGGLLNFAPRLVADAASVVATVVIVGFAGLYLAFHPQTYVLGVVRLLPPRARPKAVVVMDALNSALKRWLVGQLVSMILVGGTTTLGLWAVGVPSPVGLGLLAGLGQFVPVVGPMAAALPGLLVALANGPQTLLLALLVYLAAAQVEANIITPLILRQWAELPMAVSLFAVLAMGVLLGPLGVLFATPLAVTAHVLVRKLYVEGVLGEAPADFAPDDADASDR
jgi:predicted PurR-regulated permease PerM